MQISIRRDSADAHLAVPKLGRDRELPLATDLHSHHSLIPPWNDATRTDRERNRRATHRCVELFAARLHPAGVLDLDDIALVQRLAVSDRDVQVFQSRSGGDPLLCDFDRTRLHARRQRTSMRNGTERWLHSEADR